MASQEQVAALTQAVEAMPDDLELRLLLAKTSLAAGDADNAVEQCKLIIARRPDHVEALRLGEHAARVLDDAELAEAYGRLASLIEPEAARPEPLSVRANDASDHGSDARSWADADVIPLRLAPSAEDIADAELPRVTLADVGGLVDVKHRIETSFLAPMRSPGLREAYGKSLRGGLLLWGPPGCGKTFLARALAGELGARFIDVALHEVLDMYLGQSEQNLHSIFETARRHSPTVLFLDEVDALGQQRAHLSHSPGRNIVVQLLNELDGVRDQNDGLFVVGATNQPWDLDAAVRRPGRFDRTMLVLPPDQAAREAILEFHLRGRPTDNLDLRRLAARTATYSGADLRLVCEAATELAMEASMASGRVQPIRMKDLERAVKDVAPSTGPWFEVARNYVQFANTGGRYDELLVYMRENKLR